MNPAVLHQQTKSLFIQRNCLFVIASLLLVSNFCLAVTTLMHKEKTILVPATLSKDVAINGDHFSLEYLEEMTLFFSDLLLDLTPDNIAYKSAVALKYIHPSHYHELKEYFKTEEERFKKYGLTTKFTLANIKITKNAAEITGILNSKFGSESQQSKETVFVIEYIRSNQGLQIKSFKAKDAGKL